MKKITTLLLTVFILTGCTVNYNINIDNKQIEEITYLKQDNSIEWDKPSNLYWGYSVNEFMNDNYNIHTGSLNGSSENYYTFEKEDGVEYYKKEKISTSNEVGLKYSYKFKHDNYNLSKIANYCYDNFSVKIEDKNIKINTNSSFNCFKYYEMLDEVVINVTTSGDYEVVSSNADKQENGKYTWIINKDNAYNKPIEIELKKVINWKLILFISVPSIIVIVIVYFILKRKIIKNNQI